MASVNEASNGARYGLFVGCLLTVARFGSAAWLGVWVFVFCQFCVGTSIIWTRTRLPFMTAAMLLAAIDALLMGIWIGNNDRLTTLAFGHPVLAVLLALGTFPIFAASPRHTLRAETRLIAHFFALTILSN